jgi:hypothetical protein
MARKEEIPVIHPRRAIAALGGLNSDVGVLLAAARNAQRFLADKSLDPAKVCEVIADAD